MKKTIINSSKSFLKRLVKSNFMAKKKQLTIKQRIQETVVLLDVPREKHAKFMAAIVELIERAKSPDLFCSKCDTRMSIDLENGSLSCFNCGHKASIPTSGIAIRGTAETITPVVPRTKAEPGSKADPRLLNAITDAQKEPKKSLVPTKKGASIRNLANSRGSSAPTNEDNEQLRQSIPELKGRKAADINWC